MMFPCTKCGVCCTHIDRVKQHPSARDEESLLFFPYEHDETGRCSQLDENNLCKVYETRPLICNLERIRILLGLSEKEMNTMTAGSCNRLQAEAGIDESFRVKL